MSFLQEKVSCVEVLQEEEKIHGSPSSIVAKFVELESSLEDEKNRQTEITATFIEVKSYANEASNSLWDEKESRSRDLKAYTERMAKLRKNVDESLQQNLTRVYEDFDHTIQQMEKLCLDTFLSHSELDPFKTSKDRALVDNHGAASQSEEA